MTTMTAVILPSLVPLLSMFLELPFISVAYWTAAPSCDCPQYSLLPLFEGLIWVLETAIIWCKLWYKNTSLFWLLWIRSDVLPVRELSWGKLRTLPGFSRRAADALQRSPPKPQIRMGWNSFWCAAPVCLKAVTLPVSSWLLCSGNRGSEIWLLVIRKAEIPGCWVSPGFVSRLCHLVAIRLN